MLVVDDLDGLVKVVKLALRRNLLRSSWVWWHALPMVVSKIPNVSLKNRSLMPLISQQARSALDQQHGPTHLGLVENNKDLWYLIDGRSSSASKYLDQKHYNEAKLP